MRTLVVQGGRPLRGELHIHGAKNSILPILSACILSSERNVITRCPKLSDVTAAMEILDAIGCRGERLGEAVVVDASSASRWSIPHHLMGKMRASVTFLGALLGRFGHGEMTYPGGCTLGKRPIDYHIAALKTLGVTLEEEGENLKFAWHHRRGGEVFLPFPSVGATENVLMAAVTTPPANRKWQICANSSAPWVRKFPVSAPIPCTSVAEKPCTALLTASFPTAWKPPLTLP